MARLLVRDIYTREFEIHESALVFWPAVEVIGRIPEPGDELPAEHPTPDGSGDPKPSKQKAASRPASDDKE